MPPRTVGHSRWVDRVRQHDIVAKALASEVPSEVPGHDMGPSVRWNGIEVARRVGWVLRDPLRARYGLLCVAAYVGDRDERCQSGFDMSDAGAEPGGDTISLA